MTNWNEKIIEEFRANGGKVGGSFEGAPMVLVHHRGRRSGDGYVTPLVYLPGSQIGGDERTMYVFASAAGAPEDPQWYRNLVAAGRAEVEVGTERVPVRVEEVVDGERDRIFAEQVARMPGFGEYAEKTAGIRTIPVVALHPA